MPIALCLMALALLAGCSNGAPPPTIAAPAMNRGTLVASGRFRVLGVTAGDRAVVLDGAGGVAAISLASGARDTIDDAADFAEVHSAGVLAYHDYDPTTQVGSLVSWVPGDIPRPIAPTVLAGIGAVSKDGRRIVYLSNPDLSALRFDLMTAATDGATAPAVVATDVSLASSCRPRVAFAGHRFFASYCPAQVATARIVAIDGATGDAVTLLDPAANVLITSQDGARVLLVSDGGAAQVLDLDHSTPPVNAQGFSVVGAAPQGTPAFGYFLPGGAGAVYRGSAGLWRWSETDGSVNLLDGGVLALSALAPDGGSVLFLSHRDDENRYGDLRLARVAAAAPARVLSEPFTAGLLGDGFTRDGTRALYATDAQADGSGAFHSAPVAGGPAAEHGTAVIRIAAATGTAALYSDHFTLVPKSNGRGDLRLVDTAAPAGAARLIAEQAEADFALTEARDRVVYAWQAVAGQEGLYVDSVAAR